MKLRDLKFFILLLSLFTGCSTEISRDALSYEIITEGHLSYPDEEKISEQIRIFENSTDFHAFLEIIENVNPNRAQFLHDLENDFTKNKLVMIIGKFFNYCCSTINVKGIYEDGNKVVVDYTETGPGEAAALSQAYVLFKIPQ